MNRKQLGSETDRISERMAVVIRSSYIQRDLIAVFDVALEGNSEFIQDLN